VEEDEEILQDQCDKEQETETEHLPEHNSQHVYPEGIKIDKTINSREPRRNFTGMFACNNLLLYRKQTC